MVQRPPRGRTPHGRGECTQQADANPMPPRQAGQTIRGHAVSTCTQPVDVQPGGGPVGQD